MGAARLGCIIISNRQCLGLFTQGADHEQYKPVVGSIKENGQGHWLKDWQAIYDFLSIVSDREKL